MESPLRNQLKHKITTRVRQQGFGSQMPDLIAFLPLPQ